MIICWRVKSANSVHLQKSTSGTQLSDLQGWKNTASTLYDVRGIPANFLIDPQGKIVGKDLRGAALEKKLEELLEK